MSDTTSPKISTRCVFEDLFAPSLLPALCTDEPSLIAAAQRELDDIEKHLDLTPSKPAMDHVEWDLSRPYWRQMPKFFHTNYPSPESDAYQRDYFSVIDAFSDSAIVEIERELDAMRNLIAEDNIIDCEETSPGHFEPITGTE